MKHTKMSLHFHNFLWIPNRKRHLPGPQLIISSSIKNSWTFSRILGKWQTKKKNTIHNNMTAKLSSEARWLFFFLTRSCVIWNKFFKKLLKNRQFSRRVGKRLVGRTIPMFLCFGETITKIYLQNDSSDWLELFCK